MQRRRDLNRQQQRAVYGRSGKVKEDVDRRGIDVIAAISRACEMRPRSD